MSRLFVLAAALAWLGGTIVLAEISWFGREPLVDRLRPFVAGAAASDGQPASSYLASLRELFTWVSKTLGNPIARIFGIDEDLSVRLERLHSTMDASGFRLRQLGTATAALGATLVAVIGARLPAALAIIFALAAPLLAFLLQEQRLARASSARQHRLFLELPVVEEQLAMLLTAGYSLGAALNRMAQRSSGTAGEDLRRLCRRLRQGVGEAQALREWSALARVDALSRLTPLLSLHSEASDLGRLVSEEARATRQEVHRSLVATMEKRIQQVWVPVTVATLVPGVIFLAIPFIAALQAFGGT